MSSYKEYEYSTYSSSGGASGSGGNTGSTRLFAVADTNNDGVIDRNEFDHFVGGSSRVGEVRYGSSYRSSGYSTTGIGHGSHYESTIETTGGLDAATYSQAASYTASSNVAWSRYGAEVRGVGLYVDYNPQIIRREAISGSVQTQTQNIQVRYLQPPPVYQSGTLIVKEVRTAGMAPLPPLKIRQEEAAVAQLPPLVLRERPPLPPPSLPSETIIRHVAAAAVPPRSVVIERIPAAPAAPRDIIIERWLPYRTIGERKTIVQRAEEVEVHPAPRNVIIQYDVAQVRIVRHFQNLGVTEENPETYLARYGAELLDAETLLRQARAAGVIEDISIPGATLASNFNSVTYSANAHLHGSRGETLVSGYSSRRRGLFDFFQYGLLPADYTPGMIIHRRFVRPVNFVFPASSMWSNRIAKYKEQTVDGRVTSVTVELIEGGVSVHLRTITNQEYENASVTSSVPKLAWDDFLQVLKVFMLGNNQERDTDIEHAFDILDQGRRGLYSRTVTLSDGLISPDELRAFLSILTDEYRVDLCVFLADIDDSGQISLSEFIRMVKSGLARDIICECI